jgi:quinate dehydrogenase
LSFTLFDFERKSPNTTMSTTFTAPEATSIYEASLSNSMPFEEPKTLHLVGIGVKHSIAPPMHNFIAKSLGLPWTFYNTECATIEEAVALGRKSDTQGLVVTMPYKNSVMKHLDGLDSLATALNACNNVYRDPNNPQFLRGTNTDWLGIKGCLLEKGEHGEKLPPPPGLIVGAGGASRAAVYALSTHLHCPVIYVLNRDDGEVAALMLDAQQLSPIPKIIHVRSIEQAASLLTPYYIVSCIPDLEPQSDTEKTVILALEDFLSRAEKGVLLDMCFKPRRTRIIKQAERLGWPTVEGTHVIGYQIEEQWRLWAGEERVKKLNKDGAWEVLLASAEESTGINF